MTLDEAKKIAAIIGTADNGCSTCVRNLVEQMNEAFPAFNWSTGGNIEGTEENDYRCSIEVLVTPLYVDPP